MCTKLLSSTFYFVTVLQKFFFSQKLQLLANQIVSMEELVSTVNVSAQLDIKGLTAT